MAPLHFKVTEHVIASSYVREYAFATSENQEESLKLHVKQYSPLVDSTELRPGAVTIIAAGASGVPKEVYEPLWDELYLRSQASQKFSIRGIWIADPVYSGLSAVLNEGKFGDDPSWIDHTRDLFLLINQFREQITRPLMGIGHSFGGNQLVNLAFFHPRLLYSLILLDPSISLQPNVDKLLGHAHPPQLFNLLAYRQQVWPSRSAAEAALKSSPLYRGWDARCLALLLSHGLRRLPTLATPELPPGSWADSSDPPVGLVTLPSQELQSVVRPTGCRGPDGKISIDRKARPDLDPLDAALPLYRPEMRQAWQRMPELRPGALFLLGANSYLTLDEVRLAAARAGTGLGGSGGMAAGKVRELTMDRAAHMFPLQHVARTADECAAWVAREAADWLQQEREWLELRDRRKKDGEQIGLELSREMRAIVKHPQDLKPAEKRGIKL